ncbi:hypothetical protein GCM10027174_02050 [Salinifilum aidingensis]
MGNATAPQHHRRRRRRHRRGALLGAALLAATALAVDAGTGGPPAGAAPPNRIGPVGWEAYRDLDALAQSRGDEQSLQFSSFDRSGGNDDGFEGTYSCLRQSSQGCVIAEHAGAGEISTMWFTREPMGDVTGTGDITVELDGEVVLDAPLRDVVDGKLGDPFSWPLVANAADASGGAVIKVPMPYRESMRVTVDNNPRFYHVDYRAFPDASGVRTFDPSDPATDVLERLRRFGVADPKPPAREARSTREDFRLAPGETRTIAELGGPGRIDRLRVRIPQITASPRVVDDGRAYGPGGGSSFTARIDPGNDGIRLSRRYDPSTAGQRAEVFVDGQRVGLWDGGAARSGEWGVQEIDVPPELTAGKSSVRISTRFAGASGDEQRGVTEYRYDVRSKLGGDWHRTDVLDLGPNHPGEEQAHDYRIERQSSQDGKRVARYPAAQEDVLATKRLLESTRVRITFDGRTTVDAPLGEFFGSGLGAYDVRTMMSSIDPARGWFTAWWPMPFRERAEVELVNNSDVPVAEATGEVTSAPAEMPADAGYFHATHHRGRTAQGQDWTFLDAQGAGTFYGVTHSMRGLIPPGGAGQQQRPHSLDTPQANQRNYLEGDERFYVDGSSTPAWHGTGTEDLYEGGWYFREGTTFSMPLAGNPSHERSADGCRYDCTGAYRLLNNDAVPFSDGGLFGIEHGPANDEPGEYSSTAYWYGGRPAEQHRTDAIDLGDPVSRALHGYTAEGERSAPLTARFEGGRAPEPRTRTATTATGPVSFRVALDPDNRGLRLRRMSDQQQAYQQVRVRVDGEPAGTWMQPRGNEHHRWLQDHFDVPARLTAGKDHVRVELAPVDGAPGWSAASYTALSR